MDLLIEIDTGTTAQPRFVLNPVFIILANQAMERIDAVARLFRVS